MDASNEFKVFLSPTSASASKGKKNEGESGVGVRQRLVPVINKVFSPSHFMLAQRKTTVYKAVSGVSFQDIDIGGKRKSSSNKREKKDRKSEKKDGIYNPASEGELSLQSTKSERVRSFLGVHGEARVATRRHRHSLGSNSDRPSIFLSDSDKVGSKKSRVRSVSTTDNLYLSQDKGNDAPEKPLRSRSASRPRKSVPKVTLDNSIGTSVHNGQQDKEGEEDKEDEENKDLEDVGKGDSIDKPEEGEGDKKVQSRACKKVSGRSQKSCPSQFGNKKAKEEGQDEEPEGGYFSLEKERIGSDIKYIYEALPTNSSDEYIENDQCVEAIYVCQVMKRDEDVTNKEPIYENCELVKAKSSSFMFREDEDDENCLGKEKEQEDSNNCVPDKERYILNLAAENSLALTHVTATQARLNRRRPAGDSDSIPFIDDSENSGDETVTTSPTRPRLRTAGGVTVVTIKENDNMEVMGKMKLIPAKGLSSSSEDRVEESVSEGRGKHEQSQPARNVKAEEEAETESGPRRPARYSYPATSPSGMRVCNKVGRRLARFTPASVEEDGLRTFNREEVKVKKSMSHGDVQTHVESRDGPLSESFSDDDIRHNEEFESFSETDSDLNNLDYDLFLPRAGRGNARRSPHKTKRKPRGRSLSASQADPLMISTPARLPCSAPRSRPSSGTVKGGSDDLKSPKTFQDLLGDKHLNPPEGEAALRLRDGHKLVPLMIREAADGAEASEGVVAVQTQGGEQVVLDDMLSFTWSDAESEFEFIDFNKVEPPKTCVVYNGLAVTSAMVALTTASTTTTTTVCTDRKLASAVKRTQSMKVVGERGSSRGDAGPRWEPLLCVLPEGLAASHQGGLVRSVSGVSIRRSVRADGSRYTAIAADSKPTQDDTGAVARVTHGSQGSAPPSPQLPSSRSADSTPKKNSILQRFKMGAKNASKTKEKTTRVPDSCVEGGGSGEDGLSRSHSYENLYHSPGSRGHAPSPQQTRSRVLENQDEKRRKQNTLKIWIMEAKEIPSKKKYFCHLIVDSQPRNCTSSKLMTDMCFWGEYFELDLDPETTTICIVLMREGDKKSKKRIGSVEIDLKPSSPGRAIHEQQWYPVKVDKQDKTSPALRIRHRFQSLDVLPLSQYGHFRQYLKEKATHLCQLLEPVLPVKAKEDIATTLINIMQAENCAITFLVDLVYTDIQNNAENEHLLFRGNSVATKAIEAYMKLVGEQYLHDTLKDPIVALIKSAEDLEVDPLKISNIQLLQEHRNSLKEIVTAVWEKILQSSRNFPVELREVFHKLREQLSRQEKCELTDNLISSCVFLRFFCPAVLSPYLFNMLEAYPDARACRNLTLVAKTLQTLANFTLVRGKEKFMEFLNEFISKEQERCRTFLKAISSPPSQEDSFLEFDGKIDLGKHLALLHLHLTDVLAEINTQGYESEASRVMALVEDISALLGGSHNGVPYVRRPSSGPLLTGSPALGTPQMHNNNNNFMREECTNAIDETGTGLGLPSATNRSQSFPRSVTPVYSHRHMQVTSSPRPQLHHQLRSAASDLCQNEEHVLITAYDISSRPQISMFSSEEANNNNPPGMDPRMNNSNSYYIGEMPPPPVHQVHHQPQRAHIHNPTQPRPHPRGLPARNLSVGEVQSSADRRLYDRNCSDFFRYMDDTTHKVIAVCKDGENNIQGSQTSISQLSNIASSGYQSFAYSQSSSPVDSLLHTDNSSLLSRENGNPGLPMGIRQVHQESPLASPLHQQTSKYRAVGMHPAYLGHAGHASLHGTPRHVPRVPQPKESPNSSLSSSQSVEDLSSLRRGRTRQRRSASSSSDSSPDSHPPSHSNSHFRRAPVHTPRTNPHCSPRLVPSPALRHELRSAKQRHDRSISSRRGKSNRSCEREDLRGPPHCCDDSEDDLNVAAGSLGGAGAGGWVREGWQEHHHLLAQNLGPQQVLDQQDDQMRVIIERLMSMEQEFRHEQEMMRREMHYKDARIDAQEKKIAALDSANTHLIRTIASLNPRPGELKPDLSGDLHNDSCNASDTSDYKSSSC